MTTDLWFQKPACLQFECMPPETSPLSRLKPSIDNDAPPEPYSRRSLRLHPPQRVPPICGRFNSTDGCSR